MGKIDITKNELVWPGKYNEDGRRSQDQILARRLFLSPLSPYTDFPYTPSDTILRIRDAPEISLIS